MIGSDLHRYQSGQFKYQPQCHYSIKSQSYTLYILRMEIG